MHWRSGSRPWTLCSCPWTRCRTYRGSCSQKLLPLVISSSCIGGLIIRNRGSDHSFSLTPFPGQVKILVFCRSFHMSNLYFWSTSSIAPCYLKYIVSLHYHLWILIGMILHHIIPSLIGYIIIMLNFNCATRSFPEHNFRRRAKLMSIFLVIPFCHEQQACFRVCVVLVIQLTLHFIIYFA